MFDRCAPVDPTAERLAVLPLNAGPQVDGRIERLVDRPLVPGELAGHPSRLHLFGHGLEKDVPPLVRDADVLNRVQSVEVPAALAVRVADPIAIDFADLDGLGRIDRRELGNLPALEHIVAAAAQDLDEDVPRELFAEPEPADAPGLHLLAALLVAL